MTAIWSLKLSQDINNIKQGIWTLNCYIERACTCLSISKYKYDSCKLIYVKSMNYLHSNSTKSYSGIFAKVQVRFSKYIQEHSKSASLEE